MNRGTGQGFFWWHNSTSRSVCWNRRKWIEMP